MKTNISVVIPVFNEEGNLNELHRRLTDAIRSLKTTYEIIFVDDGSRDRSGEILNGLVNIDKKVKVLRLSRNFGQQAAITAGLGHASGEIIITIDADLQDPPELLPQFVDKIKNGYDVVYGVSRSRHDPLVRKFFFNLYYKIMQRLSSYPIPQNAGIFAAMRRPVVESLRLMMEQNRFLPAMRSWVGFKQIGIPYEKPNRFAGKENQSFVKLFKMGFDALLSFSNFPLRWATILGLMVSVVAFILIIDVLYQKFVTGAAILGWSSTLISILFIGSVQLLTVGLLGEYLGRIYDEVKKRPHYVISERVGF